MGYTNSPFSQRLAGLIDRIERGDSDAWAEFKRQGKDLDGEYSQTFSVACAELVTRDPTFFLRRYLAGDSSVIPFAKRANGWVGQDGRDLLNAVYDRRGAIAGSSDGKAINQFRLQIHQTE